MNQGFVPAKSKLEAVARICAVAGVPPINLSIGSTERREVLVALADLWGIPDEGESKPDLGRKIVLALGGEWEPQYWSAGSTITLAGLNALMRVTHYRLAENSCQNNSQSPFSVRPWFCPARSKLEAVNRLSALTNSGAEYLGPGSKEHKRVFRNLADGLCLGVDQKLSKPELVGSMVLRLGGEWGRWGWSTGSTITLDGLNTLLQSAEGYLRNIGEGADFMFATPLQEAEAMVGALAPVLDSEWKATEAIVHMREAEFPHWNQMEWPGFYFEFLGLAALTNTYGGGPFKVLNTVFDYRLQTVWDLKSHSIKPGRSKWDAPLNDMQATDECVEETGSFGVVVLSGNPGFDNQVEFRRWHWGLKYPGSLMPPISPKSRRRKTSFDPLRLSFFHFGSPAEYKAAQVNGTLGVFRQGVQPSGQLRKPKYGLRMNDNDPQHLLLEHSLK